jgi:hypothetical protein
VDLIRELEGPVCWQSVVLLAAVAADVSRGHRDA